MLYIELKDIEYQELMRFLNKKQPAFVSKTLNTLKQCTTGLIFRYLSRGVLHQSFIKDYDNSAECDVELATNIHN